MMRNGQNKRMRGRNRNNNNQSSSHHNRGHQHHNPLTRVYESNGPDVKIRGTAHHVAEKYLQLARDATSVGDHVTAEAHHQHAEHYLRLIAAAQEQFRQQNPHYQPQAAPGEENRDGSMEEGQDNTNQPGQAPQSSGNQQNFQPQQQPQYSAPQPQPQPYGGAPQPQPQYSRPQQQPQQQPSYQPQPQQPQPPAGGNDVGGLPSFITGGQPQQAAPQYGSNGQDGQGDRFPMHRRRRRHRGPPIPGQDPRGDPGPEPGNE